MGKPTLLLLVSPFTRDHFLRARKDSTSQNLPSETVRKGCEQRSEREFGRYMEGEIGRKVPSRWSIGLRHELVRGFSDSFSPTLGE